MPSAFTFIFCYSCHGNCIPVNSDEFWRFRRLTAVPSSCPLGSAAALTILLPIPYFAFMIPLYFLQVSFILPPYFLFISFIFALKFLYICFTFCSYCLHMNPFFYPRGKNGDSPLVINSDFWESRFWGGEKKREPAFSLGRAWLRPAWAGKKNGCPRSGRIRNPARPWQPNKIY